MTYPKRLLETRRQRRRMWSKEDLEVLRRDYGHVPTRELVSRLGRTTSALESAVRKCRLKGKWEPAAKRPKRPSDAEFVLEPLLRELVPAGWTDREIGARAGFHRATVSRCRQRLGIPCPSSTPEGQRRLRERAYETWLRNFRQSGLPAGNPLVIRSNAYREFAAEHGWPEDVCPRCVQILNTLASKGPMTGRRIAEAIGMEAKGRYVLRTNRPGGTYLAVLIRRGLLVAVHDAIKLEGHRQRLTLYTLSLEAMQLVEQKIARDLEREARA